MADTITREAFGFITKHQLIEIEHALSLWLGIAD